MKKLSGQLAYITGGSSGIGLATARRLALENVNLVLFARGQDKLDAAEKEIREICIRSNQSINTMPMDVSDNDDVQKKITMAIKDYGIPDILINSAGVGSGDYFENITYDQFDKTMKINVYGTRNTVHAILPFLKQKGNGHIVNLSSVAGLIGMFGYSLYGTTKYALVGFSECLRAELKRFKIAVTLVCPPEVKTPFIEEEAKTLPPESRVVKSLAGFLEPEAVAETIVKGIKKRKFLVVPGILAKSLLFFHRISNGHLTRTSSDWIAAFSGRRSYR